MSRSTAMFLKVVALSALVACGGDDGTTPPGVKVTVSPPQASLGVGESQQFAATVTGTDSTVVAWTVSTGPGTITQSGLYTAPALLAQSPATARVRAAAVVDSAAFGEATVTITGASSEPGAILPGYAVSQDVHNLGDDSATLCVQAVYLASELTGGQVLVTTGTLTESSSGSFAYSSSPQDRLRVVFASGTAVDLFVTAFNGDFNQVADSFLYYPHDVRFRAAIQGVLDLTLATMFSGGSSTATIRGTCVFDGVLYSADLTEQGSYSFDISGSGAEFERQHSAEGTVNAPGFSMTVSESYWYKSIYVTQYVENMERIVNNSWTVDGVSYRLSNARIRKSFVDARPAEFDSYWIAQGSFLKGNAAHGQIGMGVEGLQLRIWLDTPDERIQLEAWNL